MHNFSCSLSLLNPFGRIYTQAMDKDQVAEILLEIGTLLELKGKIRSRRAPTQNAARTIESLSEPLAKLVAEKRLGEIKGIGEALEQKITELVETGKLAYYDELKASIPPGLIEMLEIPGLGPKKIQALNKKLGVDSVEKLEAACKAGKVARTRRLRRKDAGEFARRHRAPPHLRLKTSVERRAGWRPNRCWKVCAGIRRSSGAARPAVCGGSRRSLATLICWRRRKSRRR